MRGLCPPHLCLLPYQPTLCLPQLFYVLSCCCILWSWFLLLPLWDKMGTFVDVPPTRVLFIGDWLGSAWVPMPDATRFSLLVIFCQCGVLQGGEVRVSSQCEARRSGGSFLRWRQKTLLLSRVGWQRSTHNVCLSKRRSVPEKCPKCNRGFYNTSPTFREAYRTVRVAIPLGLFHVIPNENNYFPR